MRSSEWSSDVCSSDLDIENEFYDHLKRVLTSSKKDEQREQLLAETNRSLAEIIRLLGVYLAGLPQPEKIDGFRLLMGEVIKRSDIEIGRASCRERVCQYVYI